LSRIRPRRPKPLLTQGRDFLIGGKAFLLQLGEQELPVALDLEGSPTGADQLDLDLAEGAL